MIAKYEEFLLVATSKRDGDKLEDDELSKIFLRMKKKVISSD